MAQAGETTAGAAYDASRFLSSAPVDAGTPPASLVIDDMTGWPWIRTRLPPGEEPGTWYTYNDGTGVQAPLPTLVADTVSVPSASGPPLTRAACTESLSPFTTRAAFGFNFAQSADALPDGGAVYILPYDVSAHSGISFWVIDRLGAGGRALEVLLPDSSSDPTYGQCLSSDGGTDPCFDDFLTTVPLSTTRQHQTCPTRLELRLLRGRHRVPVSACNGPTAAGGLAR